MIDLPAGEVPIEVFYINGGAEGCLQIMTAEGSFPTDGATDHWRLLDYKPAGKVLWPGISADGWKVTIPPPGTERKATDDDKILDALLRVESPDAKVTPGLDVIYFHDPECSRPTRFPNPVPFPGDPPGAQDDRPPPDSGASRSVQPT